MLDDNNQNTLQLPFEYHHVPDFGSDFIKSGKIVSTDDSMGLVLCLSTKGSIDIESGLNSYSIKEKEYIFILLQDSCIFSISATTLQD